MTLSPKTRPRHSNFTNLQDNMRPALSNRLHPCNVQIKNLECKKSNNLETDIPRP